MRLAVDHHRFWSLIVPLALALALQQIASAQTVQLQPTKDNTLYENALGSLSNGAGATLYAGKTGTNNQYLLRRAVMAFDFSSIPSGSTITDASLSLRVTRSNGALSEMFTLNSLTAHWGEGTSNAGSPGGGGAVATAGDATWIHRTHDTTTWASAGGDFAASPSASQSIAGIGGYAFSSAQMASDVQAWLNDPSSNFGWILRGNEAVPDGTLGAKEFAAREHLNAAFRPTLTVSYVPEPVVMTPAAMALLALLPRHRWPASSSRRRSSSIGFPH